MPSSVQIVDNIALVPLTQTEVANLNLASLGVITIQSTGGGGSGDMAKSVFATLNPGAGFVDKAITAQSIPYTGLSSLPGGTINFLRADGTFSPPPGQVYNVVTVANAGLVTPLQPSSGANYFFRGDAQWVLLSTITLPYGNLTGIPLTFNPIPHHATHVTGGSDIIPSATTSQSGLVPILPSSGGASFFLNGNSVFATLPLVSATVAGLIPAFNANVLQFFRGDGIYAQPTYAGLSAIPATFAPSAHATRHITFGQDLIPNFSIGGTLPGLVPASPGGSALFLRADGTWFAPTGSGGLSTSSGAGLLQQLPLTAGATFYLNGLNAFALISSLPITYSQITGVPVFTGGSAGIVPNSLGGTVNFLRADGAYASPPGSGVTTSQLGGVAPLPATLGSTYYLNGINVWTQLSTISINWTQIVPGTIPAAFTPIIHGPTHWSTGSDPIGPATSSHSGLVPVLPSTNPTLNYLRGDSVWQPIPVATPGNPGLVPTPDNNNAHWLRGDASFQPIPAASTITSGLGPILPGTTNTFLRGDGTYAQVLYANLSTPPPGGFVPQAHAATHITGGSDIIPVFSATSSGVVPLSSTFGVGSFLQANGIWATPSGAGNVLSTLQINTSGSIQGGGDLSVNRTHSLKGDVTTPAASSYYGTNNAGTLGWFLSTSQPQATSTLTGLVPTPTGFTNVFLSGAATFITPPIFSSTTPGYVPQSGGVATNFLSANGTWVAPPTATTATTLSPGLVPSLVAAGNQTLSYLRGDDTWQLISALSIAFGQLTGVPVFSGTTSNGLVPGAGSGSASQFLAGDSVWRTPPLSASGVPGYIAGLPSANSTTFWARGDNSWQLLPDSVLVSSPWQMPSLGGSIVGIAVNTTVSLDIGMTVLTGMTGVSNTTICFMEITGVVAGTPGSVTLTNRNYQINPAPLTTIPGGLMFITGPGVAQANITGLVPAPSGQATQFLNGVGQWTVPAGSGGSGTVFSQASITGDGSVGTPVQLVNDASSPGPFKFYSTDAVGNRGWLPLSYSWETSAIFVQPGVGATQTISLITNVGLTPQTTIVIEDSGSPSPNQGFFEVVSVNVDGIHVVIKNQGYALTITNPGGGTFATAAAVTLAGPGIANFTSGTGYAGFLPAPTGSSTTFLNASGSYATPPSVTTSAPGYAPTADNVAGHFLNSTGGWSTPSLSTLVSTSGPGAVVALPLTSQSTQVLRADDTWVAMSSLSAQIAYASLSGLPSTFDPIVHHARHISTGSDPIDLFSTSTTTSGLVPGSNGVGVTFFLTATGTWATPPSGPGLAIASTPGLLQGLPASAGATFYLDGTNTFVLISTLVITYSQLSGTVPFATTNHHATHLDNGSDIIPVVAGVRTGLVPVLPASAPTTKFLRGDATWTVIPNVTVSTPGLITAFDNNTSHFYRGDGTYTVVPPVSTSIAGLAPVLPASNAGNQFLNANGANGTWVTIPLYWSITSSFTQPATSANITGVVFTTTTGLLAGMSIVTVDSGNVANYYTVASITDGTHAVLTNTGGTGNTAAVSTVNVGVVNLSGPPVMTGTGGGLVPIPHNLSTEFLCGNGSWAVPPSTGVPTSRNVSTQFSLSGGGALSADLTLNLVNDTASPGAFQIYGTNTGGTRGWFASNTFPLSTLSNPGLLPVLTGATNVWLNGNGAWTSPAGLGNASTGSAGIVVGLPATNQTSQWLRADNTWQFLPDSNVTTGFTMPAVGSTVTPVTFTSTGNWDIGMTLFFATGAAATCCYMEVTAVLGGTTLTLANRGYVSNPVATTSVPACMVFVVSPGIAQVITGVGMAGLVPAPPNTTTTFLRGDATFAAIPVFSGTTTNGLVPGTGAGGTTNFLRADGTWAASGAGASTLTATATFLWPSTGSSTASIAVVSSSLMIVGCAVYLPTFGTAEVTAIADGTHCVLRNNGNSGNVAGGGTVSIGTGVYIGTAGAKATGTSSGMIPPLPNDATQVLLGSGVFGALAYSSLGSIPTAPPLHETTHVTGGTDIIGPPTTSVSGLAPLLVASNQTNKWLRGDASWQSAPAMAISTSTFTWPASGGTVAVIVDSSANMHVNMALYAPALGVCEVTVITDATHITIRNNNNTGNAGSTAGVQPAFYVGGGGGLCTTTSSGSIPIPGGTANTFFSGASATFVTPPSVTTSAPGYVPTAPASASQFLNGLAGAWTTPPSATSTVAGYVPTPPNNTFQFLNGQAAFVTPCLTYSRFTPYYNIPFGTTYPTFNVRGSYGLPVLDCADAATTDCLFSDIMPQNANLASGLTVIIKWTAHTAVTGAVRWQVAFGRLNSSIATATFDTAGLVTSTVNGTIDSISTATVTALTTINGITSGDLYVVKVSRLGADGADTMTDTAELCSVEVRSAGT